MSHVIRRQRMARSHLNPEQEQALARLKCAHCQSLVDCAALGRTVVAELRRRYRVDCQRTGEGFDVTDSELADAVREAIECFLCNSHALAGDESRTPAA